MRRVKMNSQQTGRRISTRKMSTTTTKMTTTTKTMRMKKKGAKPNSHLTSPTTKDQTPSKDWIHSLMSLMLLIGKRGI